MRDKADYWLEVLNVCCWPIATSVTLPLVLYFKPVAHTEMSCMIMKTDPVVHNDKKSDHLKAA